MRGEDLGRVIPADALEEEIEDCEEYEEEGGCGFETALVGSAQELGYEGCFDGEHADGHDDAGGEHDVAGHALYVGE